MSSLESNHFPRGGEIYTLAQSRTEKKAKKLPKTLVSGEGTQINNNPALENRAKRKTINTKMILSLIDVAKEKGDLHRVQAYWNTYHCQRSIVSVDGRLYGKYCKNRFCTTCCSIRKAELINKYYPILSYWEDIHFVTLTVKSCKAKNLNKWVDGMFRAFNLIKTRCNKRYQRNGGTKLMGVKSLECNFNPKSKTYNPHFHIIVPNKETAELLKKEWLFQWKSVKTLYTYNGAQHIRPVENLNRDLIEIIKYGSKIFTEPDINNKSNRSIDPMIYVYALDNIFTAMKGKRIFDRFGFNLPENEKKESTTKLLSDFEKWIFSLEATDWVNTNTGECLTGYFAPSELNHLLNECIDTELH